MTNSVLRRQKVVVERFRQLRSDASSRLIEPKARTNIGGAPLSCEPIGLALATDPIATSGTPGNIHRCGTATEASIQRKVRPYLRGVKRREPIDIELLAMALLDIVDTLEPSERDKLAVAGQQTIERLRLKTERDQDDHKAA